VYVNYKVYSIYGKMSKDKYLYYNSILK
jgi:hypothetical protein